MTLLPRSNLSEKLHVTAAEYPGWSFELERAAYVLDEAIWAWMLDRDSLEHLMNLTVAWGHAHAMYNEASGKMLQAD